MKLIDYLVITISLVVIAFYLGIEYKKRKSCTINGGIYELDYGKCNEK